MDQLDRLKQQKNEEAAKKAPPSEPDEMEDYLEMPRTEPINTASSVFDRNIKKRTGGLNTAPSLFDRAAIFHTESEKENL